MKQNKKVKICLASSSGGHFEQLMMLLPLMKKYDGLIVTEKNKYKINLSNTKVSYVMSINRTDKTFVIKFLYNIMKSLLIVARERPDYIISTGALAAVPMMVWTKIFGGKVIYIESFAKIHSPNISGKIAYKFADRFYVQWESMKEFYPNAIYLGGIY